MPFLEDYTLLDELGQGGFATVYKVRHNQLGYIRAIRVLNQVIANGEDDVAYRKFLDECRILLRLGNGNHPNIVHIYQPLLRNQRAIVEMDYVKGDDLLKYLRKKSMFIETDEVIRLIKDIGSALAYCHNDIYEYCMSIDEDNLQVDPEDATKILLDDATKNRLIEKYRVIHNDIHSGNIIRRDDGSYVILDFGLAIEGDSVVRSSRRRNGAPEFKAPEKWDGESTLSTESDVYSFGVVIYECLAGQVPFVFNKSNSNSIEEEYKLSMAHKEKVPAPIVDLRKTVYEKTHPGKTYSRDYPEWLDRVVMKCLAKNPQDRYRDCKELYLEIQQLTANDSDGSVKITARQVIPILPNEKRIDDVDQVLENDEIGQKIEPIKTTLNDKDEDITNLSTFSESTTEQIPPPLPVMPTSNKIRKKIWKILKIILIIYGVFLVLAAIGYLLQRIGNGNTDNGESNIETTTIYNSSQDYNLSSEEDVNATNNN